MSIYIDRMHKKSLPLRSRLLLFVTLLAVFLIFYLSFHAAKQLVFNECQISLSGLSNFIEEELKETDGVAKLLSGSPAIATALLSRKPRDISEANELLTRYSNHFEPSVCYLLDSTSLTIASSNWDTSESFIGDKYGFRPYFFVAITGEPMSHFARGTTTQVMGYYSSHPVFDVTGKSIGVVVIKRLLVNLDRELESYSNVLFTTQNDVIVASSEPELVTKSLYPLKQELLNYFNKTKLFGTRKLDFLFPQRVVHGDCVKFKDKLYYLIGYEIVDINGYMYKLVSVYEVFYTASLIALVSFLCTLIIAVYIYDKTKLQYSKKLAVSEERLSLAVIASEEGVWDYKPSEGIVYFSPVWYTMLGYEPYEFPAEYDSWKNLVHPDDIQRSEKIIHDFLTSKNESYEAEFRMKKKDGSWCWIKSKAKTFERDKNGNVVRMVGIHKDITIRKKAQEEIESINKMKAQFVSMASHELRSPLGPIREAASILLDGLVGELNDEQKEFLEIINSSSGRLTRLVNDVLDFQKLEAGKMDFDIKLNSISEMINDVYHSMSLMTSSKGINFLIEIEDGIPDVNFDKDKITQVLVNFVNNAVKFTEEGSVKIFARLVDNMVEVGVNDTGPGIKEEDIDKLFHSFQQLNIEKKREDRGTGLGLVISKEIISCHKGKVWVESEFGKGSTFLFSLPLNV